MVDEKYCFRYVNSGCPGGIHDHDAAIFRDSKLLDLEYFETFERFLKKLG